MIWKWGSCCHSGLVPHDLTQQQKQARIDSCLHFMTPIQHNICLSGDVMSRGSAMPCLRRNNSPCNGDITTVLLQKKSPTSADMWKTIGIGLLGHTRNPAHRLASSRGDSEQQHLLWHCDPSAPQNSAAEEGQVAQESVLVARQCSPTLVQTDKGSSGWTWVHSPPTSSLLSRFSPPQTMLSSTKWRSL
jgi:hypothetical protein